MAYDYTSLPSSEAMVTALTDIGTSIKLLLIGQNLADSAGVATDAATDAATYYRPYYVAARQLQRNRDDQTIIEADGAKFTNLTLMIRSLLEEQIALDAKYGLAIPAGYDAQAALDLACGCGTSKSTFAIAQDSYMPIMTAFTV